MNERNKQIIPDSQAVARCLDKEILELLNSHATFTIDELLEKIKQYHFGELSGYNADLLFRKIRKDDNYGYLDFLNDLNHLINRNPNSKMIAETLVAGTKVVLLPPDGKGWQKGTLKICFEFIPEEIETVVTPEKQVETDRSPLDDIRASLIESN
jgi:KGK domain